MIKEIYPHHLACLNYKLNLTSKTILNKNTKSKVSVILNKKIDKPVFKKFIEHILLTNKYKVYNKKFKLNKNNNKLILFNY